MARGIQIPFTLNPKEFIRGLKRIETDLDDVADAFKKVERAGDDALDDIGDDARDAARDLDRHLTRGARDAEDAFADLGRRFKDEMDDLDRRSRDAGRDIGDNLQRGADTPSVRAAGGVLAGEVFDEFIESWGEAVRSGDYGEAVRETFSNLGQIGGAAFGPVGAVGGALAGFLLTGIYDRVTGQAAQQQVAEATAGLWGRTEDAARQAGFDAAFAYQEGLTEARGIIETAAEALGVPVEEAFGRIQELAETTRLDQTTVLGSLTGDQDALNKILGLLDQVDGSIDAVETAQAQVTEQTGQTSQKYTETLSELDRIQAALGELVAGAKLNAEAVQGITDNTETLKAATINATIEAAKLAQAGKDYTNSVVDARTEIELLRGALEQIPITREVTIDVIESVVRQDTALANRGGVP